MEAKLSQEDLLEMLKLQVHMVAETAANIAAIRGKKTTLGLSAHVVGFNVSISITAEMATQ